jgi:hypothetical protein
VLVVSELMMMMVGCGLEAMIRRVGKSASVSVLAPRSSITKRGSVLAMDSIG